MSYRFIAKQKNALPTFCSRRRAERRGFTVIELMVTVAIVATLTALAAPMFTEMIERWRVRSSTEEMSSTLYFARGEAIKRGGGVIVRKIDNSDPNCTLVMTNEEWDCGWITFFDTNGNGVKNASEPILQTSPPPANTRVLIPSSGGSIAFNRWGTFNGIGAAGIQFLPAGKTISDPSASAICISSGGRVRTIIGTATC